MCAIMHEYVAYNKYYATFRAFRHAIVDFLKNIGRKKNLLKACLTDNFNVINSPLLAS